MPDDLNRPDRSAEALGLAAAIYPDLDGPLATPTPAESAERIRAALLGALAEAGAGDDVGVEVEPAGGAEEAVLVRVTLSRWLAGGAEPRPGEPWAGYGGVGATDASFGVGAGPGVRARS